MILASKKDKDDVMTFCTLDIFCGGQSTFTLCSVRTRMKAAPDG